MSQSPANMRKPDIGGPIGLDDPVRFRDPLPRSCDAVIIGGGIVGVSTAIFLARAGLRITLCEKGRIAAEQSSRNWGWVRQQGRDPAELPLMIEAMRLWQGFQDQLGDRIGLRRCGVTYFARDHDALARYAAWLEIARAHGLDTRMISRAELAATLPDTSGWMGGLTTPSDARAEPWTAVPAMAGLAHDLGVAMVENCAARLLDIQNGQVGGVHTEQGLIRAPLVLLAGGAWSGLFARNAGVMIPQLSVRGTVMATQALPDFWSGAAADDRFAFRRRLDGGYTLAPGIEHDFWIGPDAFRHFRRYLPQIRREIRHTRLRLFAPRGFPDSWGQTRRWGADQITPFERMRVLNPAPDPARLRKLQDDFATAFPQVERVQPVRAWGGMIDVLPDQVPVLDAAPLSGLFVATGLSGHGFGIGPAIGRVMADLMRGQPPGHDLHRFRLSRFSDGSSITLGPTV